MGTAYEGARNAVNVCMGVKPGERVLVVTDLASYDVGNLLRRASLEVTSKVNMCILEQYGERPLKGLPAVIRRYIRKYI